MHRFIWKIVSETLVESSRAPPPSSQFCFSLQSLRLLSSISTSDSDNDDDTSGSNNCTKQQPSANRASSVLKFFQDCGFSQLQAESIVSKYPRFLCSYDPVKTFKPKISFLHSIGIPEADVVNMVTRYPPVLYRSLNNHLIPAFDLLKSLLGSEDNAIWLVKRCPVILRRNIADKMPVNLSILRNHGVPMSSILKMMSNSKSADAMENAKPEWLSKVVESVINMGFRTSSVSFGNAVTAMGVHTESTWEEKLKFYQGLGFSRVEIFSMFRKQPIPLRLSQKKVREAVEFYNSKFHWGPSELATRPSLMMYSLQKRVIPRCSVLQVLWSRNKTKQSRSLPAVLVLTDKVFLETYVTKYQAEVPEVLDAYQGKLNFKEYNFAYGVKELAKTV